MADVTVSIRYSKDEFNQLSDEAYSKGLSVQQYIKSKTVDSQFSKVWNNLIERIAELTNGTEFNLKLLFGIDWIQISRGIKLSIGRYFYSQVVSGNIASVIAGKKDSSNTQWYKKE